MPTVIDSLIVSLKLDTSQFAAQSKQALTAFDRTGEAADRTAKNMQARGKVAAEFFSNIKNQATGLLAVLIGGRGIEAILANTVTSLAALGRASQNIGVSVPQLATFRNTIEAAGGNADEAAGSFQRLADSMAELKATGNTAILPGLQMIGGVRGENAMQTYMRFVEFAAQHKNDVGLTRLVGHRLGLDEGSINEALKGTVQVAKDLADATKRGAPTKEMAERAQALQTAWRGLSQAMTTLVNLVVDKFAPALTDILNTITKFVEDNPQAATALGVGALAGGSAYGLRQAWRLLGLLGGGGGGAGAAAGAAGEIGLSGAAAALVGAAEALVAAAAALGAEGVVGKAAGAAGAGRALTASGRGVTSAAAAGGGVLSRVLPLAAGAGGVAAGLSIGKEGGAFGNIPSTADEQKEMQRLRAEGPEAMSRGAGTGSAIAPPVAYQPGEILKTMGITAEQYSSFRESVAGIESKGRYNIMGGSSGRFAGRYQMGATEIAETARKLGEKPPSQAQFLADPAMQERYFEAYTAGHFATMARGSAQFRAMNPQQQLEALGYAHNQGAGGAMKWLAGGGAGRDAFGTSGTAYAEAIHRRAMAMQRGARPDRMQTAQADAPAGQAAQTVEVNGPIHIHTQATDAPGIARSLRAELAGRKLVRQAQTGLA